MISNLCNKRSRTHYSSITICVTQVLNVSAVDLFRWAVAMALVIVHTSHLMFILSVSIGQAVGSLEFWLFLTSILCPCLNLSLHRLHCIQFTFNWTISELILYFSFFKLVLQLDLYVCLEQITQTVFFFKTKCWNWQMAHLVPSDNLCLPIKSYVPVTALLGAGITSPDEYIHKEFYVLYLLQT